MLFAGDLVNNGVTPLCLGGSISGWLKTLDWLAQFQPEVIVPGHGVVAGPELINQTQDYLHRVLRLAHATVDSGASLTETAANADQSPWAAWAEPERLVVNLHHAVSELTGRPVSITTAIADLLAAYGGYIPTRAPHRAST